MFNYIKENEESDLDINPIKINEDKYCLNDNDSSFRKNEMISTYQWNFLTSTKNLNLFQLSKKYSLQILFSNMKINPDINPEDITINLSKSENYLSLNDIDDKLSELLQKDISMMTKNNIEIIEDKNKFSSNSGTLFHLNVTPFRVKKIDKIKNVVSQNIFHRRKNGKFSEFYDEKETNNKSAIYVNKIKEEMVEVSDSSSNSNLSIYT